MYRVAEPSRGAIVAVAFRTHAGRRATAVEPERAAVAVVVGAGHVTVTLPTLSVVTEAPVASTQSNHVAPDGGL